MKTLPALAFLLAAAAPVLAIDQKFLEPVVPISPALKAMGGASTANATGYDALFVNPASFADTPASITFLSTEATAQASLSGLQSLLKERDHWPQLMNVLAANNVMLPLVNSMVAKGGLGAEASVRTGWVGNNLGIGLVIQNRTSLQGPSLLETKISEDVTYAGVIGLALPFDVGLGTVKAGLALKPMQRTIGTYGISDLLGNGINFGSYTVQSGFGMGWDLGVRWDYAGFKTGLAIRDAGSTVFSFREYTGSEWLSGLTFPANGSSSGTTLYRVPTVLALGTSWTPDMGSMKTLFQPMLAFDLQMPVKDEFTQPSFFTWVHLGAEAKLLDFLSVRTGLNQGYFTFGLGARVWIAELNIAVYSDELGRYSGVNRRPEISAELAFRL